MSSESRGPRRDSGIRLPVWALLLFLGLGILILIISSVWLFRSVRGMASATDGVGSEFIPVA